MDIFSTPLSVIRPEDIQLPPLPIRLDMRMVNYAFFPSDLKTIPANNSTQTRSDWPAVTIAIRGIVRGLGVLDLSHYCQPIDEHLGYIRDVVVQSRVLTATSKAGGRAEMVESNDQPPVVDTSDSMDGSRHTRIVRSVFGFDTHITWKDGERKIAFWLTVPQEQKEKLSIEQELGVIIYVCVSNGLAKDIMAARTLPVDNDKAHQPTT